MISDRVSTIIQSYSPVGADVPVWQASDGVSSSAVRANDKAASQPRADRSNVFAGWRQYARCRASDGVSTSVVCVDDFDRVSVVTLDVQQLTVARHRAQCCPRRRQQQHQQQLQHTHTRLTALCPGLPG